MIPDVLPTWAAVKADTTGTMTIYQAMDWQPSFTVLGDGNGRRRRQLADPVVTTIGDESCDEDDLVTYCDGPLEDSTTYRVIIAASLENSTINVTSGFLVTPRMLNMFQK